MVAERRSIQFHFTFCSHSHFVRDTPVRDTRDASRIFLVPKVGKVLPQIHPARMADRKTSLPAGSICLVPRNMPLVMNFPIGMELIAFHFQAVNSTGADLFPDEGIIYPIVGGASWIPLVQDLLRLPACAHRELCLRHFAIALTWQFAETVRPGGEPQDVLMERFPDLFKHLAATPPAAVKIRQLTDRMGRGGEALSKAFRRVSGMSLKDFLLKRTLEAAQRTLLFTEKPIREVADELGFPTEDACSKFLKTHTGLSPRAWRETHRFKPYDHP